MDVLKSFKVSSSSSIIDFSRVRVYPIEIAVHLFFHHLIATQFRISSDVISVCWVVLFAGNTLTSNFLIIHVNFINACLNAIVFFSVNFPLLEDLLQNRF